MIIVPNPRACVCVCMWRSHVGVVSENNNSERMEKEWKLTHETILRGNKEGMNKQGERGREKGGGNWRKKETIQRESETKTKEE